MDHGVKKQYCRWVQGRRNKDLQTSKHTYKQFVIIIVGLQVLSGKHQDGSQLKCRHLFKRIVSGNDRVVNM